MWTTSAAGSSAPPVWYLRGIDMFQLNTKETSCPHFKKIKHLQSQWYLLSCWLVQTASTKFSEGHSTIIKTGPGSVGVQTCSGRICTTKETMSADAVQSCSLKSEFVSDRAPSQHLFPLVRNVFPILQSGNERTNCCCAPVVENNLIMKMKEMKMQKAK